MARDTRRPRPALGVPTRLLVAAVVVVANLVGAGVVLVLAAWVLPEGPIADPARTLVTNLIAFGGYLLFAIPVGTVWGWRRFRVRDAEHERRLVLVVPGRLVVVQAVLWALAVALFAGLNAMFSARLALSVGATVAIGGVVTTAMAYLLCERALRRAAARALTDDPPRGRTRGVAARSLLSWTLGTGAPLVGLLLAAVGALVYRDVSAPRLAIVVLALGGTALVVGFLVTLFAARATADPVRSVGRALRRVERGELDTRVPVYDGTELGILQAGFNRMAAGLGERERIRDLFGRHVGHDVAPAALRDGRVELGGEVRDIAVLFVDLEGSTTLAASRPPTEVVDALNAFFAVVVEEVQASGGWINKFIGDAALGVFGAPTALDDPAGCALAAGRSLGARLARELPGIAAGVGVAAGAAVAGNIGAAQRFEYTVIGDPVNEAARLTELAKSVPGRVLASGTALDRAGATEAGRWKRDGAVTLRGRTEDTELARPIPA